MRWLLLLALLPLPIQGQHTLYTCMVTSKDYVVGARLPPSGIFRRSAQGDWQHAGFNIPFLAALDFDPRNPETVYLAAGNGLFRTRRGEQWKLLTGSDVTELTDVSVDPNAPGTVYFTHTAGIRVTRDAGASWTELASSLHRKYSLAVRADSRQSGVVLVGNEEGILRSADGGKSWKAVGAAGYQTLHLEQSPHDACYWLATTQGGGLFASTDCGVSFESNGRLGVDRNLADIAFDPASPNRVAVAGWGLGVALSEDRGKTWQFRNAGLPGTSVWSVAFDPDHAGRMYAGVHEEALYISQDYGRTWVKDGLPGSRVFRMKFVPDVAK